MNRIPFILLILTLCLACDESQTTTNITDPGIPGDDPIVTNTVNTSATCTETSASITCTDSSFCQSSAGVAELCSRIAWQCFDAATGEGCGEYQNQAANGDAEFRNLTPATDYSIHQTAFRSNGDHHEVVHHITTEN